MKGFSMEAFMILMCVICVLFWGIELAPFIRKIKESWVKSKPGLIGICRMVYQIAKSTPLLIPLILDFFITTTLVGVFMLGGSILSSASGITMSNVASCIILYYQYKL